MQVVQALENILVFSFLRTVYNFYMKNMTIHRLPNSNDLAAQIQDDILAAVQESADFHNVRMDDYTGQVVIRKDDRRFKIELHEIL